MSLIAIDLDGTLINNNHEISNRNIEAIKKAQDFGHEVVIATGRAHFDVQRILQKVGLSLYVIGANGATVHSPSGTNILSIGMPKEKTEKVIQWLDKENYYYELFCDGGIYTPVWGREVLIEEMNALQKESSTEYVATMKKAFDKQISQAGYVFMDAYDEVYQKEENIFNILVFSFQDRKRNVGRDLFNDDQDFMLVSSSIYNFELEHPNASKGKALSYLAKVLNMDLEHSMAIGDSGNDLSMLGVVTNSFAMGNAEDYVKEKAIHITTTNDEDGVAEAIYHYLKLGQGEVSK